MELYFSGRHSVGKAALLIFHYMTWLGPLAVPSLQPELPTALILLLLYPTTTTYSFILRNLFHWRPRDRGGENKTRDLFLFFTHKNVDPLSCWLWDVYSPEYYRARDQQKSETRTQIFTTFVLWNCHFFIFPTVSSWVTFLHNYSCSPNYFEIYILIQTLKNSILYALLYMTTISNKCIFRISDWIEERKYHHWKQTKEVSVLIDLNRLAVGVVENFEIFNMRIAKTDNDGNEEDGDSWSSQHCSNIFPT